MKKTFYFIISILVLILLSCKDDITLTSITLDKSSSTICVGGTTTLVATISPTEAIGKVIGTVTWSSSDTAVAKVVNGVVTGISIGSANIVAKVGDLTANCTVTISAAITSITLNKTSIKLKVDSTQTLTATMLPEQSVAVASSLLWTSTNPSVATVNSSGKITAISDGSASIVASIGTVTAICTVTVYTTVASSLLGTNYYLLNVDASTANLLGSANIAADFRADDAKNFLYIWEKTFSSGTYSSTNFYGNVENWISLVVGSVGWSGAAINVKPGTELDKLKSVTDDISGKYYLHFAIKSSTTNSYAFKMGYGASAVTFVLGTAAMESTNPYGNFTRNGQWQEVEIPMSYFKSKGLTYTTGMAETNVFVMLAGGTAGTKLEVDAAFIYKKP